MPRGAATVTRSLAAPETYVIGTVELGGEQCVMLSFDGLAAIAMAAESAEDIARGLLAMAAAIREGAPVPTPTHPTPGHA